MNALLMLGAGKAARAGFAGARRFKGATVAIFAVVVLFVVGNWKTMLPLLLLALVAVVAVKVLLTVRQERAFQAEVDEHFDGNVAKALVARQTRDRWPDLAQLVGLSGKPVQHALGLRDALRALDRSPEARLRRLQEEPDVLVPEVLDVRSDVLGYRFDVKMLDGQTFEHYVKAAEPLAEAVGVREVRPQRLGPGAVSLLFAEDDPLALPVDTLDFPEEFDTSTAPIALDEYGKAVSWPFSHTLIVGASGSGKGSVLWSIIRTLLAGRRSGLVRFYGIDPKFAELAGLSDGLFESVAFDADDIESLLADLVHEMNDRRDGSRRFTASEERPYIVLVIDEILSVKDGADRKQAQAIDDALLYLLSKGRSLGIYVVGAIQRGEKAAVGAIRDYFGIRIGLRLANATETNMVLGEGATDEGAGNHLLTPATEANGYETAGLGWMRTDDGMTRLRFPYTNDKEIALIVEEFEHEPEVVEGELMEEDENDGH